MRWFQYPADGLPSLSSINPYRLICVRDHFGANAHVENLPVPELRIVTIIGLYHPDSPEMPKWVRDSLARNDCRVDFLISCKEWIQGASMQDFRKRAGQKLLLTAPQHPEVSAEPNGLTISSGDGSFQAFGVRVLPEDRSTLASGVAYRIKPVNTSDTYRWAVAPDMTPITFERPGVSELEAKVTRLQAMVEKLTKTVNEQAKELQEIRKPVENIHKGGIGKDR
ncbi:MAG: hypothetical protein ACYC6N_16560 [Pirellulaceae bacterium]